MVDLVVAGGHLFCVNLARTATGSHSAGLVILKAATWTATIQRRCRRCLTGSGGRG